MKETTTLKILHETTQKIYDFGIISHENPIVVKRRANVVNFLMANNYSVRVIQGWKEDRDKQLASCRIVLNIHGSNNGENSNIFEHIRCDRLLAASYNILSESSLFLDKTFIENNRNHLKMMEYDEFFNSENYKTLGWL
jgi:hypothetical protein